MKPGSSYNKKAGTYSTIESEENPSSTQSTATSSSTNVELIEKADETGDMCCLVKRSCEIMPVANTQKFHHPPKCIMKPSIDVGSNHLVLEKYIYIFFVFGKFC